MARSYQEFAFEYGTQAQEQSEGESGRVSPRPHSQLWQIEISFTALVAVAPTRTVFTRQRGYLRGRGLRACIYDVTRLTMAHLGQQ